MCCSFFEMPIDERQKSKHMLLKDAQPETASLTRAFVAYYYDIDYVASCYILRLTVCVRFNTRHHSPISYKIIGSFISEFYPCRGANRSRIPSAKKIWLNNKSACVIFVRNCCNTIDLFVLFAIRSSNVACVSLLGLLRNSIGQCRFNENIHRIIPKLSK